MHKLKKIIAVLISVIQVQGAESNHDPFGIYDEDCEIQCLLKKQSFQEVLNKQHIAIAIPQYDMLQLQAFLRSIDINRGHQGDSFLDKKSAFIPYCKKQ